MTEMIPDPERPDAWIIGNAAEPIFGEQIGATTLVNVHPADRCAGSHCVVHNPSDHHMRGWPLNWRGDRRMMERLCPHGVGHPDPDSMRAGGDDGTHGCDGCCFTPETKAAS